MQKKKEKISTKNNSKKKYSSEDRSNKQDLDKSKKEISVPSEEKNKKEETKLEEALEESEEDSKFIAPLLANEKFSPSLQKTESVSIPKVPLEEKAEEFVLAKNKKSEKKDYTERESLEYGEKNSENKNDYSMNPNTVKSSRLDYEDLGRETETLPSLGIHQEFNSERDHDYVVTSQRIDPLESTAPFQKRKSEYRTR